MTRTSLNKKTKQRIIALISLSILLAIWGLWFFVPVSKEEQHATALDIITETRYVLYSDSIEIFDFTSTATDTIPAQWTRRYALLPYCGSTMAVEAFDTADVCSKSDKILRTILEQRRQRIATAKEVIKEQEADIAYFLRTHTVIDNGFDIVARYGKELLTSKDSILRADSLIHNALKRKQLTVRLDRRYFIKTGEERTECIPVAKKEGILLLQMQPVKEDTTHHTATPADSSLYIRYVTRTRLSASSALPVLKARHPQKPKKHLAAIDSLGTYTGSRDADAAPHGYGRFLSSQGDFYEGEWEHGQRCGVGFSMVPGKRLRLGEWKEDRFLGERIAYTPERIYGIDISRYQHEKGRKRFGINWKNLRITSLGHLSKKTIHGKVDYPVRFIFIKATEGATVKNRYFPADYANARKYGYKTGAYHFFSVKTPGRNQAINFLRNSRYSKGDLPPVLDLEPSDKQIRQAGGIHALFNNVRSWLNAVESQRGVRPILYISQRFVNKYLPYAPDLQKNYDVWIARYGEYKPDVNLVYWQLSPDGRVNGIKTEVDINVYNGFNLP